MIESYDKFIQTAIDLLGKEKDFLHVKKKASKICKLPIPTNADMREHYESMIKEKKVKRNPDFEKILKSRGIRTQSGVAVIAVLTKSYPCPGKCTYCPTEENMPKSYLSNEPAVMRAISSKFNPYEQVQNRLRSLELNGHATDKIELIVMGGTFSYLPKDYQKQFVSECFRAANDYPKKINQISEAQHIKTFDEKLSKEQKRNENAKHRIVGLTLETRPDYLDEEEIANFRMLGCTRVEIGVQSIFDDVLEKTKRGHFVSETIRATKLLKDAGFKINYHIMPGLPGSSPERDFEMFKELFSSSAYQPDMIKIYPTVVVKNSALYQDWKKGKYIALTDENFETLLLKIKNEIIPPYVRIARIVRDVPVPSIEAGPIVSNLRQIIAHKSQCPCIRCREVRSGFEVNEPIILNRIDYPASEGKEIFLEYVSKDKKKLFAMLRLRIPQNKNKENKKLIKLLPALKDSALIREVHTYGVLTKISHTSTSSPQHIGLGKKLLAEAEKIAKEEFGFSKIIVISGIGVRGYYRKNGYRLDGGYMSKKI